MDNKSVIILCQYFYPEYISSAELPYQTAMDLSANNMKIEVLCGYPYEYLKKDKEIKLKEQLNSNLKINRIKYSKFKKTNAIGRLLNYFSFTFFSLLNVSAFKNKDVCIVYSNPPIITIVPYIAKKIYGTKIIFVSYDIYPEIAVATNVIKNSSLITKIMNGINKIVFPSFDRVIALSSEMKILLETSRNISSSKIEIIPNWYDNSRVDYSAISRKNRDEGPFTISYFGNMGTAQDMETIKRTIMYFKNNDDYSFMLVGHGNKKQELRLYFEQHKVFNVKVLDFLQGNELNEKLSVSDVFLVSLNRNLSGLAVPSKTYTYLAMGKPVMTIMEKSIDIAKELKLFKAGFTVENSDSKQLNEYIHLLRNDKELHKKMSENAFRLYEAKYTRTIATEKYKKIIEEM
ncbi:MAG: glycosyltransferase WbuB [Chlorobiaceae bacterium]|nr:glycosyltransferase WbuB [Chlorobiaceae bacterium]